MPGPLHDVMRIRRPQPTRLEGFVDASFAFAVTLVVISIGHVPASVEEMLTALHGVPTFAVCFLLISRIWLSHREWSRCYDLEDSTGVSLSLLLVFIVLFYVYPLRMLFAQMFLGFSGGGLSDGSVKQLVTVEELRAAYLVFGLGFAAISTVFVLLFRHALRHADAIGLACAERAYTRMKIGIWITQAALALASIALACCLPALVLAAPGFGAGIFAAPGLVYATNIFFGRMWRARCRRTIAALPAGQA
ncbi:MAG: DUF1211 domain-containing protein [Proteobacteria bacterium]|nr:DUF1211 domain-containing protein [Pseudomonadota bacterium]